MFYKLNTTFFALNFLLFLSFFKNIFYRRTTSVKSSKKRNKNAKTVFISGVDRDVKMLGNLANLRYVVLYICEFRLWHMQKVTYKPVRLQGKWCKQQCIMTMPFSSGQITGKKNVSTQVDRYGYRQNRR